MPDPDEGVSPAPIPTWALERAREELYDERNPAVIEAYLGAEPAAA